MAEEDGTRGDLKDEKWDVAYMQSPARNDDHQNSAFPASGPHAKVQFQRPNLLLRDFLQERWKGLTPILWGQQLKQERLDELIYLCLLNADHLPDDNPTPPDLAMDEKEARHV